MKKLILIVGNDNIQLHHRIIELAKEAMPVLELEGLVALDSAINEAETNPLLPTGDMLVEDEFGELAENCHTMTSATIPFVPIFERMLGSKTEKDLTEEDVEFMMKLVIGIKMTTKTMLTAIMDYSHVVRPSVIEDLNEISLAANMMLGKLKPIDYKFNSARYKIEAKLRQAMSQMNFDPDNPPDEEEMARLVDTLKQLAGGGVDPDDLMDAAEVVDPEGASSDAWLEGLKQSIGARSMRSDSEEQQLKEGDVNESDDS